MESSEARSGAETARSVTLKLYASLERYLPAGSVENSIQVALAAEENTALDLLRRFNVPPKAAHLVLVNGFYLNHEQRASDALRDGDVVAMWPPVAGG